MDNVSRQNFKYRAMKRLADTSEGEVDALFEVRRLAAYNAETIRLIDHITNATVARTITLRYIDGVSIPRIMQMENKSESTIYKRLRQGIEEMEHAGL